MARPAQRSSANNRTPELGIELMVATGNPRSLTAWRESDLGKRCHTRAPSPSAMVMIMAIAGTRGTEVGLPDLSSFLWRGVRANAGAYLTATKPRTIAERGRLRSAYKPSPRKAAVK